ncbi:MAG: GGDEF domain-containing protein [Persicimonas sp.]
MAEESSVERDETDEETTVDVAPQSLGDSLSDPSEAKACLIVLAGPLMGHTLTLGDSPRNVGRAGQSDIVVNDTGVSRRHARFHLRDDGAYVEDLDSSNGVYVNGKRIERIQHLEQGDKITLGTETILKFTYQDELDEDFQQRLLDSAIRDPLTGLYNRAYFDRQAASELRYARRHNTRVGLILFDLDHFKEVNDTHGHLAGDAVLEQLGAALTETIRVEDFMARYGGEELAMICRGLTAEQTFRAAERLRQMIAQTVCTYEDLRLNITASAGVASFPETPANSLDELIGAADEALYRAKAEGRNRTCQAPTAEA